MLPNAKKGTTPTITPAPPGFVKLWGEMGETKVFQKIFFAGHLARLLELAAQAPDFGEAHETVAEIARYLRATTDALTDDIVQEMLDRFGVKE